MNINVPQSHQFPALRKLWKEAFGDTDAFLDIFAQTAFSKHRARCMMSGDEAACALYWFDCLHHGKPIAYLYAVATAKAYRHQGLCHKLMEDTHYHLERCGYEGAILVPGNQSLFDLYQSMGYKTCSGIHAFQCAAGERAAAIRRIEKEEYAKIRKSLLPAGGVVQEKENLDFFETQAYFYTGPDFLLAARKDADSLYGIELLGDENAAPGIVSALGFSEGRFRTPGDSTPFAMYRSLGKSALPPPSYFGLAYD